MGIGIAGGIGTGDLDDLENLVDLVWGSIEIAVVVETDELTLDPVTRVADGIGARGVEDERLRSISESVE